MLQVSEGWHHLHPLSPVLRSAKAFVVVAIVAIQQDLVVLNQPSWVFVLEGIVAAVAFFAALLAWRFHSYRIYAGNLEIRQGVIFRSHRRLSLERIESVDVVRPLMARMLGLVELRIEVVSSSGKTEGALRYLAEGDVGRVRDQLHQAVALSKTDDVSSVPKQSSVVYNAHLIELILGYGIGRMFVILIPPVVTAISLWSGTFYGVGIGLLSSWLLLLIALGSSLAAIEQFYGFTLSHTDDYWIVERGLINQLTQRAGIDRVQALRLEQPLLWRMFDRARIHVDLAGYRGASSEDNRQFSTLVPITKCQNAHRLLSLVLDDFDLSASSFVRSPDRAKWRAPLTWRFHFFAWTDKHALVKSGCFTKRLEIVPHHKLQSMRLIQGPWLRRLHLNALHLDTAGHNINPVVSFCDQEQALKLTLQSRASELRGQTSSGQPK